MARRSTAKLAPARLAHFLTVGHRQRVLAGAALIACAAALAYFPALRGGFILDDNILLTDNGLIKAPDGWYRIWCTTEPIDYWPVFNTAFWLQWRLWGLHPTGYHVVNLILHIITGLLIWIILHRLSIPGAFVAALLFAVHPVNVETVAWISQCKGLLAMLFFLLSILSYLQAEEPAQRDRGVSVDRWYWLSLVAFALAMLSKGSVAILPAVLLGIVWWLRPLTRRDLLRTLPFVLIAVVLVRVNVWFQTHGTEGHIRSAGVMERLVGAGAVVWFYLSKALVPVDLAFIYPQWHVQVNQVWWWLPLLAAVAVTCVLWWRRHGRSRAVLFAWGYFCIALVPVLGFTDITFMEHSLVADHYQHLALVGPLALAAAARVTWQKQLRGSARWLPNAVALAVGSALVAGTWRQSSLYADPMTLYQATVEKNPGSWLAHNNLGGLLFEAGQRQEAIEHFEQAVRLNPEYPDAHSNLGSALRAGGRLQEAIHHDERALGIRPDYPEAHNNLGTALSDSGRLLEAIDHYERALRLKPAYPEAHNNLGIALAKTGRLPEAVAHLQEALRLKPDYADARDNLGVALAIMQKSSRQPGDTAPGSSGGAPGTKAALE